MSTLIERVKGTLDKLDDEQLKLEAKREDAERRAKHAEKVKEILMKYINENEVYFIGGKLGKYVKYSCVGDNAFRWLPFSQDAMYKTLRLTSKEDRDLFDDLLTQNGRMKDTSVMSFDPVPNNVLNFLKREVWLKPVAGDVHPLFDIVMESLSDGKKENRDHLEQCIVYKYLHPEDYRIPCITISGSGGVLKNDFVEQTLSAIFSRQQVAVLGVDAAFGQHNGQMLGKTVVFIDENVKDIAEASKIKRYAGNKTININEKFGIQDTFDNTAWYWIGANDTNGALFLEGEVTDRRYSVLTVSNSAMYHVAKHLQLPLPRKGVVLPGDHACVVWYRDNQHILSDSKCVSAFLAKLIEKWGDMKNPPSALHGEDYKRMINLQHNSFHKTMEHIFQDPQFTHIERDTLFQVYTLMCAKDGQKQKKTERGVYADTLRWLEVNVDDIQYVERANLKRADGKKSSANIYKNLNGKVGLIRNTAYYIGEDKWGKPTLTEHAHPVSNPNLALIVDSKVG